MEVKQVYEILNSMTQEALGESVILEEDLSNVVEVGGALLDKLGVENATKTIADRIGKTIFVNRPYAGSVPSIMKDDWTYGSILQKLSADLPEATINEAWELQNGQVYSQEVYYKPTVSDKYWNMRVSWAIPMSFADKQANSAFKSATDVTAFFSMIETAIQNSMTIKMDELIMRAINNMIAETVYDHYSSGSQSAVGGPRAINLLYDYNNGPNAGADAISAAAAWYTPEFIRYAAYRMGLTVERLTKISSLFNLEGKDRFTPTSQLHVVLHADFEKAASVYLQSDVFNKELVALPKHETVPYWQGSGTGYAVSDTASVDVVTADNHNITVEGILGVMFDDYAVAANCIDRYATSAHNSNGEFTNVWNKATLQVMNAKDENFVVFFVA